MDEIETTDPAEGDAPRTAQDGSVVFVADLASTFTFASHQNSIPVIRSIRICISDFVVSYPSSHISWASAAASFTSATRIVRSKSRSLGKMAERAKGGANQGVCNYVEIEPGALPLIPTKPSRSKCKMIS